MSNEFTQREDSVAKEGNTCRGLHVCHGVFRNHLRILIAFWVEQPLQKPFPLDSLLRQVVQMRTSFLVLVVSVVEPSPSHHEIRFRVSTLHFSLSPRSVFPAYRTLLLRILSWPHQFHEVDSIYPGYRLYDYLSAHWRTRRAGPSTCQPMTLVKVGARLE